MDKEIESIQLKFACTENWDAMNGVDGGRHCDKCQKKVYDFTNSKAAEFTKILAENNGNICGHFSSKQIVAQTQALQFWKRWASAAVVVIGISLSGCEQPVTKTYVTTGIPLPPRDSVITQSVTLTQTEIDNSPDNFNKFDAFIKKNMRPVKGVHGTVMVRFKAENDISITHIRIIKGLSKTANKEALRLVKCYGKWIPNTIDGKPQNSTYTIPIAFK